MRIENVYIHRDEDSVFLVVVEASLRPVLGGSGSVIWNFRGVPRGLVSTIVQWMKTQCNLERGSLSGTGLLDTPLPRRVSWLHWWLDDGY